MARLVWSCAALLLSGIFVAGCGSNDDAPRHPSSADPSSADPSSAGVIPRDPEPVSGWIFLQQPTTTPPRQSFSPAVVVVFLDQAQAPQYGGPLIVLANGGLSHTGAAATRRASFSHARGVYTFDKLIASSTESDWASHKLEVVARGPTEDLGETGSEPGVPPYDAALPFDLSTTPLSGAVRPGSIGIDVVLPSGETATIRDNGYGRLYGSENALPGEGTVDYATGSMTGMTGPLAAHTKVLATYGIGEVLATSANFGVHSEMPVSGAPVGGGAVGGGGGDFVELLFHLFF